MALFSDATLPKLDCTPLLDATGLQLGPLTPYPLDVSVSISTALSEAVGSVLEGVAAGSTGTSVTSTNLLPLETRQSHDPRETLVGGTDSTDSVDPLL